MNPAECLPDLWRLVEQELNAASEPPARTAKGVVAYELWSISSDTDPATSFFDGGSYFWNDGLPRIRLYRRGCVPAATTEPDLRMQPAVDACILAHEYGHFCSDKNGSRTQSTYDELRHRPAVDVRAQQIILAEEQAAWTHARAVLAVVGCTDWVVFEEVRARSLGSYERGFAEMNGASSKSLGGKLRD